jgi:cobalt/nickel transport system permease protein
MHHSYLDKYANGDSFFHRLDARTKFVAAMAFTAAVLLSGPKSAAILFCYTVGPFAVIVLAGIPAGFVFRRILVVCPFVLVMALSCPLYDRAPETVWVGPWAVSLTSGWLRAGSIMGKFVVTMMVLMALVSTTRFADLLAGLERMGLPSILAIQLGMLYRYLFVLVDRVHHMLRARAARTMRRLAFRDELRTAAAMVGAMFIRSVETSQNIHIAMQARGFTGRFHSLRPMAITRRDAGFALAVAMFILAVWRWIGPMVEGRA